MKKSQHRWLIAIIVVATILRLGSAFYMGNQVTDLPGLYDQISYNNLARRVLTGHGFSFAEPWWPMTAANAPTAHWSFLYTLYLALVYAIFGYQPLVARLIQAVLTGILMPWLIYRLGKRVFGSITGLVAAGISAVYIYFVYYDAALMTEAFFMVGILWIFEQAETIRSSEKDSIWQWLGLGIAMSLTVLLRQTFLPILGLVFAWLWFAKAGRRREVLKGVGLSLIIVVLAILPWTIRNYLVFHEFVLLNTNAGYVFFWANHPIHDTNFVKLFPTQIYMDMIPQELHGLNEAALEKALMSRGIQFIRDDPARYFLLSVSRLKDQFFFWPSATSGLISNLSRVGSFGLFLPFMIYGIFLATDPTSFRRVVSPEFMQSQKVNNLRTWLQTPVALWLGFFILYNAIHLASWTGVRYRLPTDTVLVIFAAVALVNLMQWFRMKRGIPGRTGQITPDHRHLRV